MVHRLSIVEGKKKDQVVQEVEELRNQPDHHIQHMQRNCSLVHQVQGVQLVAPMERDCRLLRRSLHSCPVLCFAARVLGLLCSDCRSHLDLDLDVPMEQGHHLEDVPRVSTLR